jgi:beta-lactamase class A
MSENAPELQEQFAGLLEPHLAAFSGDMSVAFYRFADNVYLEYQAERPMHAASLIKLPIMLEVLSQCDVGECQLDAPVTMSAEDQVSGSGVLQYLSHGLQLSMRDLVTLMIIVSDNTATNLLIDHVGVRAINRRIAAVGLRHTELIDKLQLPAAKQNRAKRKGAFNVTCASAMLAFLVKLQQGQLMSPDMTALALSILQKQQYTEALARYLPTDTQLHPNAVTVACKSGCLRGVWHDAGIVSRADGTPLCALVIMTEGSQDGSFGFEQEGMMTIASLSRDLFATYVLHLA